MQTHTKSSQQLHRCRMMLLSWLQAAASGHRNGANHHGWARHAKGGRPACSRSCHAMQPRALNVLAARRVQDRPSFTAKRGVGFPPHLPKRGRQVQKRAARTQRRVQEHTTAGNRGDVSHAQTRPDPHLFTESGCMYGGELAHTAMRSFGGVVVRQRQAGRLGVHQCRNPVKA